MNDDASFAIGPFDADGTVRIEPNTRPGLLCRQHIVEFPAGRTALHRRQRKLKVSLTASQALQIATMPTPQASHDFAVTGLW